MTPKLADYIRAGRALNADERLEAAHQLLLSVDRDAEASASDVASAWEETIDRRVAEVVSGTVPLIDGPRSHARIRAEIAATRR